MQIDHANRPYKQSVEKTKGSKFHKNRADRLLFCHSKMETVHLCMKATVSVSCSFVQAQGKLSPHHSPVTRTDVRVCHVVGVPAADVLLSCCWSDSGRVLNDQL